MNTVWFKLIYLTSIIVKQVLWEFIQVAVSDYFLRIIQPVLVPVVWIVKIIKANAPISAHQDLFWNKFVSAHCFDSDFHMLDHYLLPIYEDSSHHINLNVNIDRFVSNSIIFLSDVRLLAVFFQSTFHPIFEKV